VVAPDVDMGGVEVYAKRGEASSEEADASAAPAAEPEAEAEAEGGEPEVSTPA